MDIAILDNAPVRYATLNRTFHRTIIACCGNSVLQDVLSDLEISQAAFHVVFRLRPARSASSNAEHKEIVAALRARDGVRAGEIALLHKLTSAKEMAMAVNAPTDAIDDHKGVVVHVL